MRYHLFRSTALLAAACAAIVGTPGRLRAQADITFSGGNGAPISLTLNAPVTYTITTLPTDVAPVFDFLGVGEFPAYNFAAVTGTITYRINGGPALAIGTINNNVTVGDIGPADTYLFGTLSGLMVDDSVTLSSGTVTTEAGFAGPAPAGGSFTTVLTDNVGTRISNFGIAGNAAAPEPAAGLLLMVALPLAGEVVRRRSSRSDVPSSGCWSRPLPVQKETP